MAEYSLLVVAAVIIILQLSIRTNTAIAFLALCAGSVLAAFSGDNFGLIASSITSGLDNAPMYAQLALLFTPFIVVVIILRGQVHKTLLPIALIPAACSALLAVIFASGYLSDAALSSFNSTETWKLFQQYQEPIVGIGVVASIVMLTMTNKKPHEKHHKKHKKHH